MQTNLKPALRWSMILGWLVVLSLVVACAGVSTVTSSDSPEALRIRSGVVQVQSGNGAWVPVAGNATFELVGELEDTDPWTVAGVTLETNESTQVADDLEVGDLVRVRGAVLEEDAWVAYSIEPAEAQTDPIIILIGIVDSVDPWVVNGIELNITDETDVQGGIIVGQIVRVEILLLSDGTWEVLSIAPLGASIETSGCATVIATVVSVNGDEIQFLGWPLTVTLKLNIQTENGNDNAGNENDGNDNDGNDNDGNDNSAGNGTEVVTVGLSAGQVVLAVVCLEDGNFVIVQIVILNSEDDNDGGSSANGEKVLVCHKPNNKKGGHTLSIASAAVPAHLGHGDTLGACP